jgi:chromosome segregation ATPase
MQRSNPIASDEAAPVAPAEQPKAAKRAAPAEPAPDERDATIERLERGLAEERQHAATLRGTVEDLRFKMGILEKSYAKQLADARLRAETAERGLAEEKARLSGIDGNHENTLKLLTETRAQLANVLAERDWQRKQLAQGSRRAQEAPVPNHNAADSGKAAVSQGEGTINSLMADLSVPRERPSARPEVARLGAQARDEGQAPAEEMISPDLVFPKRGDDEK